MEIPVASVVATCSICGESLSAKGECLVCLLRTGLDESVVEIKLDTSFVFGEYELFEEIGRGGQAVVYRARQKSLNRIVALKVIGFGHWESTPHLKRFRHEAEAAASLEHPQIVPIYEIGESDGSCYFSMKFVEGGQLAEVLKRGSMSTRRAAELLAKIARTVHFAHQHGILHRDIKPGNILLDREGEPHLTDFGLARLLEQESTITHSSDVLGTPSYMSPEQAAGRTKELTAATDVYSLGAVFYQMLTGEPPFAGGTTYETIRLLLESEPRNPRVRNAKIDREVSTICLKCLEKDPKRRYSSALALAEDLEHWLKHEPIRARRTGLFGRGKKWVLRNPSIAVMAALLLALAAPLGVMIWKGESEHLPASNAAVLEKRIAVLPFENLSKDEENAFFVGGMQDEILTDLAKVADLKVISRTSVMKYKSDLERNLREIAKTLAVSHVVEGSVQRAGGRVRVNVQLIDARNDAHLWAEHYDRDFADVFAIQSEIAQTIADQLQAKLSPKEKAAIAQRPTKNLAAYDLYLRAKELIYEVYLYPSREKENALKAVQLLDQAVARDPTFLLAHCQLAYEHDLIYFDDIDHTETHLALAEASVRAAVRLQPDAGETHLAQATHFYWGYRNYDRAREELAKAQRALPNNAEIFHFLGLIAHRQGRWDEIIPNLEHAVDLDPRNASTLLDLAEFCAILRKHRQAIAMVDLAVAVEPRSAAMRMYAALMRVEASADMVPLRTVLNTIEAEGPESAAEVAVISFELALRERDPAGAARAFANLPSENYIRQADYRVSRAWHEGLLARLRQDAPAARAAFMAARAETEKLVRTQPQNVKPVSVLALIDAELGDREKAIREGRTACDMVPISKDALDGTRVITILASIYALTGEKDLALEQLETVSKIPCGPSYGGLRLDPEWDLLRGDPRFEKIVASLAPKWD